MAKLQFTVLLISVDVPNTRAVAGTCDKADGGECYEQFLGHDFAP